MVLRNLIYGGNFPDLKSKSFGLNHKTGEKVEIDFIGKVSDEEESRLEGRGYDSNGNLVLEISGSWLDEIYIKTLATGNIESIWKAEPLI